MRAARALLALWLALPAAAQALALDELMAALRAVPQRHAAFEETKHLAVLTQPLVRRGTLEYTRPDRLRMQVDSPYFERLTIAGDALTIERRSGTTQVSLASQPALAAWLESLRATLAGDTAALTRSFDATLEGTLDGWRLTLVPRDPALRAVVAQVAVAGRGGEPTRFATDEVRGDSTVVVITPRKP